MMRTPMRYCLLAAMAASLATSAGCAYYNTFFNAKRAFEKAEDSRSKKPSTSPSAVVPLPTKSRGMSRGTSRSSATRSVRGRVGTSGNKLYETAIEKSAKVLKYYPESDYVDDALLLMAKSYYRLGKHSLGLRKCDELLTTFPTSDLASEARYWRGMLLWQTGRKKEAREILDGMAGSSGSPFRGDAAYALAEMESESGNLEGAISYYKQAVKRALDPEFRYAARGELGDGLMRAGRYGDAAKTYQGMLEQTRTNKERFDLYTKIATAQREAGLYRDALNTLVPLLENEAFIDQFPQIQLQIGRTHTRAGDVKRGVFEFEGVIKEGEKENVNLEGKTTITRSPEAKEAHYWLGRTQEEHYGNLGRAAGHYEIGSEVSLVGPDARERLAYVKTWQKLRGAIADTSDSTGKVTFKPDGVLALAQHFYLNLVKIDSAMHYYQIAADSFPKSPLRHRAAYAVGWIYWKDRRDSVRADSSWQRLMVDTTRSSELGEIQEHVREMLGRTTPDPALEPYRRVEQRWVSALDSLPALAPDSLDSTGTVHWWSEWRTQHRRLGTTYLDSMKQIIHRFGNSPSATRARYVLGWYFENVEADTAAAFAWYRAAASDTLIAPEIAAQAHTLMLDRVPPRKPVVLPDTAGVDTVRADSLVAPATDSLTSPAPITTVPDSNAPDSIIPKKTRIRSMLDSLLEDRVRRRRRYSKPDTTKTPPPTMKEG